MTTEKQQTHLTLENDEVEALARLLKFTAIAKVEDTPASIQNKLDYDLLIVALGKTEIISYTIRKRFCTQTIAVKDSSDMTQYGICHNPLPCDGPHASS